MTTPDHPNKSIICEIAQIPYMLVVLQQNIQCKGMLFIRFLLEHVFLVMPTKLKLLNCSTISKHCHLKICHINPNYQNMRKKRYQVTLWKCSWYSWWQVVYLIECWYWPCLLAKALRGRLGGRGCRRCSLVVAATLFPPPPPQSLAS